MKIKKGDKVLVISGKDRGKTGEVIRAIPEFKKIIVSGVNIKYKHERSKKGKEKGQRVEFAAPMSASNVKLICPKCSKAARVGYKILSDKTKRRICKKCQNEL